MQALIYLTGLHWNPYPGTPTLSPSPLRLDPHCSPVSSSQREPGPGSSAHCARSCCWTPALRSTQPVLISVGHHTGCAASLQLLACTLSWGSSIPAVSCQRIWDVDFLNLPYFSEVKVSDHLCFPLCFSSHPI